MANTGKLPASKVGSQWRFRKEDVDQWFKKNKNIRRDERAKEGAGDAEWKWSEVTAKKGAQTT